MTASLDADAWLGLLRAWLVSFALEAGRYVIVAFAAFFIFWVWGRDRFSKRLIQGSFPRAEKLFHDLRWSARTALVFSIVGVGAHYGGRCGVLRLYEPIGEHGIAYFVFSIAVLIVLQDTYFYWTHRAMHHPLLYRSFHRVHHASTNPSPLSAYAFGTPEAIVHAIFVPLVWLVIPLHELAVFTFLLFMILRNVLGHLSMELYWKGFTKSRFWGLHTTTTHHSLHHKDFRSNFGLYFTFWDRVMHTTHARYDETFESVVTR
jgi:lathosterol oxidase